MAVQNEIEIKNNDNDDNNNSNNNNNNNNNNSSSNNISPRPGNTGLMSSGA